MLPIDKALLDELLSQAAASPRLRINYDLRTSSEDGSQRMLNAMMPGTQVAIHRHPRSTENVIVLCGRMDEIVFSSDGLREVARYRLSPADGSFGCCVPAGAWHTVEVLEPTVIFEAKDGRFGEDGSEVR